MHYHQLYKRDHCCKGIIFAVYLTAVLAVSAYVGMFTFTGAYDSVFI